MDQNRNNEIESKRETHAAMEEEERAADLQTSENPIKAENSSKQYQPEAEKKYQPSSFYEAPAKDGAMQTESTVRSDGKSSKRRISAIAAALCWAAALVLIIAGCVKLGGSSSASFELYGEPFYMPADNTAQTLEALGLFVLAGSLMVCGSVFGALLVYLLPAKAAEERKMQKPAAMPFHPNAAYTPAAASFAKEEPKPDSTAETPVSMPALPAEQQDQAPRQ